VQHRYKWNVVTGEVEFSDSWFTSLGYDPSEFPHHVETWEKLVHPSDLPSIYKYLAPCLNGEEQKFKIITRLRRKDGVYRYNLDHGKCVKSDKNGKPIIIEGYDIPLKVAV